MQQIIACDVCLCPFDQRLKGCQGVGLGAQPLIGRNDHVGAVFNLGTLDQAARSAQNSNHPEVPEINFHHFRDTTRGNVAFVCLQPQISIQMIWEPLHNIVRRPLSPPLNAG